MTFIADEILRNREQRHDFIRPFVDQGHIALSLKANIPGPDKRIFVAYLVVGYYEKLLANIDYAEKFRMEGADGPSIVYIIKDTDPLTLKNQMIEIEENSPYGRLVDLDVHADSLKSLNREFPRKCLVCGKNAFDCSRNMTHPMNEVLAKVNEIALSDSCKIIMDSIDKAMSYELNLDPKFGLVTPYSMGSHKDMDYQMMLEAKKAIMPYFEKMFISGWETKSLSVLFKNIREIGIQAEEAMHQATNGVNCYKGLIFNLGIVCAATGFAFQKKRPLDDIFDIIKNMTSPLIHDFSAKIDTSGLRLYQEHGIGGARMEAMRGMPTVQKISEYLDDYSDASLTKALVEAIVLSEDTVLAKRAKNPQTMEMVKAMFKTLDVYDKDQLEKMTTWCIAQGLSFGGAADILVSAIFYRIIDNLWHFQKIELMNKN